MKKLILLIILYLPISVIAQKIYVEKADGGAEKVLIDKLLTTKYQVTFKEDSADYILKTNVKKMSLGRAKGGVILVNAKSGALISKSKDIMGSAKLANGYDNPVADVLRKTAKKYLVEMIEKLN